MAALSADEARGKWRNEFFRGDTLAARVTSLVGWMDLRERKLVVPPEDLLAAIRQMPRTDDFAEIPARA